MSSSFAAVPERKGWLISRRYDIPFYTQLLAPRQTQEELKSWVQELGRLNRTNWTVRDSRRNTPKFEYQKTYHCHHSSYKRISKNTRSKNLNCRAKIQVAVRRDEITYPTAIDVFNDHSHPLDSVEVLGCLRPTKETREAFNEYFKSGMGIKESLNHHQAIHNFDKENFADSSVNPKYSTVCRWYNIWYAEQEESNNGNILKQSCQSEQHQTASSNDTKNEDIIWDDIQFAQELSKAVRTHSEHLFKSVMASQKPKRWLTLIKKRNASQNLMTEGMLLDLFSKPRRQRKRKIVGAASPRTILSVNSSVTKDK